MVSSLKGTVAICVHSGVFVDQATRWKLYFWNFLLCVKHQTKPLMQDPESRCVYELLKGVEWGTQSAEIWTSCWSWQGCVWKPQGPAQKGNHPACIVRALVDLSAFRPCGVQKLSGLW